MTRLAEAINGAVAAVNAAAVHSTKPDRAEEISMNYATANITLMANSRRFKGIDVVPDDQECAHIHVDTNEDGHAVVVVVKRCDAGDPGDMAVIQCKHEAQRLVGCGLARAATPADVDAAEAKNQTADRLDEHRDRIRRGPRFLAKIVRKANG